MRLSQLFLILFASLSLGLVGCVGSDSGSSLSNNGENGNQAGKDDEEIGTEHEGSEEQDDADDEKDNSDNSNEQESGDGEATEISLCELPSDSLTSNLYPGIGTKDAYTLGAPNNYTEDTSGTDLTGTWVMVSKTKERQPNYAQIAYSKNIFIIKKDADDNYIAANCRASHSEPIFVEQWYNNLGNPVKAHCKDFLKTRKDDNGDFVPVIPHQPEALTPEGCLDKSSNDGLKNIKNPQAVTKKLVATGSTSNAPWNDGFTTAILENDAETGANTLTLPINDSTNLNQQGGLVFTINDATHSELTLAFETEAEQENNFKEIKANYKAYKVSKLTNALGKSDSTFTERNTSTVHSDTNSDIVCVTQSFKIERESCEAPTAVPAFSVITNTHHHALSAIGTDSEDFPHGLHVGISESEISPGNYRRLYTGNLGIGEADWFTEVSLDSGNHFDADDIRFEMTISNKQNTNKKAYYKFEVDVPNPSTP